MDALHHPGLTVAVALAAGILAQSVSRTVRLPGIVLLLASGAALGPDGLGWIQPRALGEGLFGLVDFGVAIILFEGGLNLEWSRLRRQEAAIRGLITVGALVTVIGAAGLAGLAMGWSWPLAMLFGALVVVTGPTVIQPLLRDMRLRPRLKTILEAEGVLIDPIGALLAGLLLQLVIGSGTSSFAWETAGIVLSIGFGLLAGLAAGFLLAGVCGDRPLVAHGYENVFVLATVVLLFEACDGLQTSSGLVAVTVAGIVMGNLDTRVGAELREFKDQLTVLLVGMLFVLLSADVAFADIRELGWAGVIVVSGLVVIVRPACAWVATLGLNLPVRERVFIAAIAPRGIVAAAITSITAASMDAEGLPGGTALRALVFSTIAGTVVLSGVLAYPMAWLLDVRLPRRERVAIFGARGLAPPLADALKEGGVPVLFVESDPRRSHAAEQAGHSVVFGDPLDERTLQRARMELVESVVGLTFNEHIDSLFVREARDAFGVPHGYVALEAVADDSTLRLLRRSGLKVLFDGPHDQARWDVRWRHGDVALEKLAFDPKAGAEHDGDVSVDAPANAAPVNDRAVLLTIQQDTHLSPYYMGYEPSAGNLATAAVYGPQREEALADLRQLGWYLRA